MTEEAGDLTYNCQALDKEVYWYSFGLTQPRVELWLSCTQTRLHTTKLSRWCFRSDKIFWILQCNTRAPQTNDLLIWSGSLGQTLMKLNNYLHILLLSASVCRHLPIHFFSSTPKSVVVVVAAYAMVSEVTGHMDWQTSTSYWNAKQKHSWSILLCK